MCTSRRLRKQQLLCHSNQLYQTAGLKNYYDGVTKNEKKSVEFGPMIERVRSLVQASKMRFLALEIRKSRNI